MYYKTNIPIDNELEFLASDKLVSFTGTVVNTGVSADTYGKKIVHKGSLIAKSGKVVKTTVASGAVSFSEDPVGILLEAKNVTHGEEPCALMVEGYVLGERLPLGVDFDAVVAAKIQEFLPEIKFR